jgi:hypothetical protein
MGLCVIIAEEGSAEGAMDWSPFGYSVVSFGEDGKAKNAVPEGALT